MCAYFLEFAAPRPVLLDFTGPFLFVEASQVLSVMSDTAHLLLVPRLLYRVCLLIIRFQVCGSNGLM